ncbi:MAG: 16S rRNA (uracil(1498)-N(3))-methyltransferase [Pseudomonadota bacterium]
MRKVRLYTSQHLASNSELELDDDTRHYAFNVLRLNKNASLYLFNGDGFDYCCKILNCNKSKVVVKITHQQQLNTESKLGIQLYLGISKSSHMDYAIQKTVESGVSTIQPVLMERTVTKVSQKSFRNKHQHWQRIIQSACEQSGRAVLPVLFDPCELDQIEHIKKQECGLLFDASAKQSLNIIRDKKPDTVKLLVGPEGGLAENEVNHLMDRGFQTVKLGPRVLRTETAAVAAVITTQLLTGDMLE